MIPMLVCSATTLVLHGAFLYTFTHMLGWGFRGAAVATSVSGWVNGILLVFYAKFSGACEATWKSPSREAFVDLYEFVQLAVPSCVMVW